MEHHPRPVTQEELPLALALVRRVFLTCCASAYSKEGVQTFLDFITPQSITAQVIGEGMRLSGVFDGVNPVSVLALARGNHISLLFTDPAYHHGGMARALVYDAVQRCKERGFEELTVHADLSACGAYRAMGFTEEAPKQYKDGIAFLPMKYVIP